jgi:hypothetical protein
MNAKALPPVKFDMSVPPETHPSGIQPVVVITDAELNLLIHTAEVDAGRWGVNPAGYVESPALYERAITRMRFLQEVKEAVAAARTAKEQAELEEAA